MLKCGKAASGYLPTLCVWGPTTHLTKQNSSVVSSTCLLSHEGQTESSESGIARLTTTRNGETWKYALIWTGSVFLCLFLWSIEAANQSHGKEKKKKLLLLSFIFVDPPNHRTQIHPPKKKFPFNPFCSVVVDFWQSNLGRTNFVTGIPCNLKQNSINPHTRDFPQELSDGIFFLVPQFFKRQENRKNKRNVCSADII